MSSDYTLPSGDPHAIEAENFRRIQANKSRLDAIERKFDRFVKVLEQHGILDRGEAHWVITGDQCLYDGSSDCPFAAMCERGTACSRAPKDSKPASYGHAEKLLAILNSQQ